MAGSDVSRQQEGPGLVEQAYRAASRGLATELESVLSRLRQVDADEAFLIQDRLRSIARCVRSHPASGVTVKKAAS